MLEWNTNLHFNSDIGKFLRKINEWDRSGQKVLFNFFSLALHYLSMGEGLWVGAESLI